MKNLFTLFVFGFCLSASAYDVSVVSNGNFVGLYGDVQGSVYARGNLDIQNFEIRSTNDTYAVAVFGDVNVRNASISSLKTHARIGGKVKVSNGRIHVKKKGAPAHSLFLDIDHEVSDFIDRAQALEAYNIPAYGNSSLTLNLHRPNRVSVVRIQASRLARLRELTINGTKDDSLVIIVEGIYGEIRDLSIRLQGNIQTNRIAVVAPDALTFFATTSGLASDLSNPVANRTGMPFTILAPHADFTLTNGLLTGQIYAEDVRIGGDGQVNFGILDWESFAKKPVVSN